MSEPFLGEIRIVGFNFEPVGWAFCRGQLMSIAQNNALFALLGTQYGGDGQTTFALPDLQGRFAIHQGQGQGLSSRTIGEKAGTEDVTLAQNELPIHTHFANADNSLGGNLKSPVGAFWSYDPSGQFGNYAVAPSSGNNAMNAAAVSPVGGSQPHNNRQPFLGMNYIIALEGIFPSQN
jgi:microcystin-dependent protein